MTVHTHVGQQVTGASAPSSAQSAVGLVAKPYRRTYHKQGYEIVLGYEITGPHWAAARDVVVTYQDWTGQVRTVTQHSTFVSCPRPLKLKRCLHRATGD